MPTADELLRGKQQRIDELHRPGPGRTALLVVDMQRGFLEPGAALEVPPGRAIIPALQRLIEACRRRQVHEYLNCDVKGNINSDGLPNSREELHGKLERFMSKLAGLPQRVISYFKHKFIAYAAAPTPEPAFT